MHSFQVVIDVSSEFFYCILIKKTWGFCFSEALGAIPDKLEIQTIKFRFLDSKVKIKQPKTVLSVLEVYLYVQIATRIVRFNIFIMKLKYALKLIFSEYQKHKNAIGKYQQKTFYSTYLHAFWDKNHGQ